MLQMSRLQQDLQRFVASAGRGEVRRECRAPLPAASLEPMRDHGSHACGICTDENGRERETRKGSLEHTGAKKRRSEGSEGFCKAVARCLGGTSGRPKCSLDLGFLGPRPLLPLLLRAREVQHVLAHPASADAFGHVPFVGSAIDDSQTMAWYQARACSVHACCRLSL